jgi:hypothetical protein|eukprot:6005132-Prymnesium_polylepis.1
MQPQVNHWDQKKELEGLETSIETRRSRRGRGPSLDNPMSRSTKRKAVHGHAALAIDTGEEGVNTGCVNTCLTAGINTYQHLPKSVVLTHPVLAAYQATLTPSPPPVITKYARERVGRPRIDLSP